MRSTKCDLSGHETCRGNCYLLSLVLVVSKNTNEEFVRQSTVQPRHSVTIFRPKLWPDFSEWNVFAAQNSRSINTPARERFGRGAVISW